MDRTVWGKERTTGFCNDCGNVEIITSPHTDLWQKTYYGFCMDNAAKILTDTDKLFFTFSVYAEFDYAVRFDQCGVIVYQDRENWIKASVEYEPEGCSKLGSVATKDGYSDWATTDIPNPVKNMYYRISRRNSDFKIENSFDGVEFHQMRICHLNHADEKVPFGVYACSPGESSFKAKFSQTKITECLWKPEE